MDLQAGDKHGAGEVDPNLAEQDRLDLQHGLFRILYDGWLSLVPFTKAPDFVLDIDSGTALWAFEFAEQNPSSTVMKSAYDNLSSAGWVEFQEVSFDMSQANPDFHGDAFLRWSAGCTKGAATVSRDIGCAVKYKHWLEEIGFIDVTEQKFLLTAGNWPDDPKLKLVGKYFRQDMVEDIRGVG
ncbi:hypothetical protein BX600DRAFT_503441 [Xylariales sp. PMI_506]|nr:hypothetical protein BX600DRAFT_503441 [Xylariales sp. PMI_506]